MCCVIEMPERVATAQQGLSCSAATYLSANGEQFLSTSTDMACDTWKRRCLSHSRNRCGYSASGVLRLLNFHGCTIVLRSTLKAMCIIEQMYNKVNKPGTNF